VFGGRRREIPDRIWPYGPTCGRALWEGKEKKLKLPEHTSKNLVGRCMRETKLGEPPLISEGREATLFAESDKTQWVGGIGGERLQRKKNKEKYLFPDIDYTPFLVVAIFVLGARGTGRFFRTQ